VTFFLFGVLRMCLFRRLGERFVEYISGVAECVDIDNLELALELA
jgi:hypothetical protein